MLPCEPCHSLFSLVVPLMTRSHRNAILGAITIAGLCVFGPSTPSFPTVSRPSRPNSSSAHLAATAPRQRTLIFVGDVMLSRGVGGKMDAKGDWDYPFRRISGVLHGADLAYCNLECPISDRGRNLHHLYSFRADPRALKVLRRPVSQSFPKPTIMPTTGDRRRWWTRLGGFMPWASAR